MHSSTLIERLREDGHRLTAVRRMVIELFTTSFQPLSAQDVLSFLSTHYRSVNKTTVYRELDFLCQSDILQELSLETDQKYYELAGHHHHLICQTCRNVFCLEGDGIESALNAWQTSINLRQEMKIISHSLYFNGLCRNCNSEL